MGCRSRKLMSFVVLVLALSVAPVTTALAQTVSLDDQTADQTGDEVIFTLSIDYPSNASGEIRDVTIDINFDHDVLTYGDHAEGSVVADFTQFKVANTQDGVLKIVGFMSTVDGDGIQPGDSGAIVELHFTAAALDHTALTIDTFTDLAGFSTRDGQFMVAMPPENHPPTATDDEATTNEGEAIEVDVLANDSDPEGDILAVSDITEPSKRRKPSLRPLELPSPTRLTRGFQARTCLCTPSRTGSAFIRPACLSTS